MVHFPPLPSRNYVFITGYSGINQSGFPHSEIPGSKPACGSPRLIAACHVLHRLLAPRHSPYALSSLTKCSLHLTAEYVVKKLPIAEYSVVKKSPPSQPFGCYGETGWLKPICLVAFRLSGFTACLAEAARSAAKAGGEYRDRTGDLLVANQALSQLS
jgi:hypothetical protein